MTPRIHVAAALVVAALAAACATGGGAAAGGGKSRIDERYKQADHKLPDPRVFDEVERLKYADARTAQQRAMIAQQSGNQDQARVESVAAADGLVSFADTFTSSEYVIPIRYEAARLYLNGQASEKAALQAEKIRVHPQANDTSRALASKLAANAWRDLAVRESKAGRLEPIRLPTADQRKGAPLQPRMPAGPWKNYVEATDAYLALTGADPDLKLPADQRPYPIPPQTLALIAAQVSYAHDNMEDARGRFQAIIDRWPGEPDVLDSAVPLYLQTFLVQGDVEGYRRAIGTLKGKLEAQVAAAAEPRQKEGLQKLLGQVVGYEQGAGFEGARKLLEEGKLVEAAEAFEKHAATYAGQPVAADALFNAAVAWDKAKEPARAMAARQAILDRYPDARVVQNTLVSLATGKAQAGDHAGAVKHYEDFLARFPEDPRRCLALQNLGIAFDNQVKRVEAAERYLAFGKDARCAAENPNDVARVAYRAGELFLAAKQRAKAKEAYAIAAAVPGVTDVVALSNQKDAKQKLKGL
jgi:tetratricopeptide (TPR) repeat protein